MLQFMFCHVDIVSDQLIVSPNNGQATLTANEVWGALRGLETFSQLIFYPTTSNTVISKFQLHIRLLFSHFFSFFS
jgi:hypothetical protein